MRKSGCVSACVKRHVKEVRRGYVCVHVNDVPERTLVPQQNASIKDLACSLLHVDLLDEFVQVLLRIGKLDGQGVFANNRFVEHVGGTRQVGQTDRKGILFKIA